MKVCRVTEIRKLDREAIEKYNISEEILMENAGRSVCSVILREFGVKDKKFVIFCGPGNKGGDGFVVARHLHSHGGKVKVFIFEKEKYGESAKKNFERIENLPIEIRELKDVEDVRSDVEWANAIIDGMFGVGLSRNVEGVYKDVIQLINKSGKKVFAIDIPSGINGDTGQEMGISVKADYTVTFGLPKVGNLLYPGYEKCGKLYVDFISYPISLQEPEWIKVEIYEPIKLPERDPMATKFSYGPTLFIAGSRYYFWAPIASAYSFLKAGGGYAYLASPKSVVPFLAERGREVVFLPQPETEEGTIALEAKDEILKSNAYKRAKIVVIGPGLSTNEKTKQLVKELVSEIEKPVLIDGDGITAVSEDIEVIKKRKSITILTPHTGEMERITQIKREEIEKNRVDILQKTTKELNSIIVLKGPHTLVGYPDQKVYIVLSGNAGMATAGSGDVLNGTICAMYALGLNIDEAVRTGVFIHGLAGDLAAKEKGQDGIVASDILESLPYAIKYYKENFEKLRESFYNKIHIV
ncbi:MAG: NAD(P)H-hydrate dehydratase [Thermoprotei archaeon]